MAEQTDNTPANGNKIEPQRMVFGKHLPFLLKELRCSTPSRRGTRISTAFLPRTSTKLLAVIRKVSFCICHTYSNNCQKSCNTTVPTPMVMCCATGMCDRRSFTTCSLPTELTKCAGDLTPPF